MRGLRVDVLELLEELGISTSRSGTEHRGHCPHPDHAARPGPGSWQIAVNGSQAGQHHCFACGFGGGLITLVKASQGMTGKEAYQWLREFCGFRIPDKVETGWQGKVTDSAKLLPFPRKSEPLWGADSMSGSAKRALEYLHGRGVTDSEIRRHRICAVPTTQKAYGGRLIVPVVVGGEMVDFVARLYVEAPDHIPKATSGRKALGARKELALWGYDFLDPNHPRVHVVEGVWGALHCLRLGVPNLTAACGSAWSPERTELLAQWEEVILIPDGDGAGSKFERRASSLRFTHRLGVVDLPPKTQPDDHMDIAARIQAFREPQLAQSRVRPASWGGKA